MKPLLARSSARHFLRHPWQVSLAILGVALGVAVVVSIDLANGAALRAFETSSLTVTGEATHQIVGGSFGVPQSDYRRLRVELGVRSAAPVIEGYVSPPERPDLVLQLLGVDPFAEAGFRDLLRGQGGGGPAAALIERPRGVLMSAATAAGLGIAPGDAFRVSAGGAPRTLELEALLEASEGSSLEGLLVADIAAAQEVLGLDERITRIDLRAPEGAAREPFLERIRGVVSPGVELVRSSSRTETAEQMTRAFRINLRALALLALLCGTFLIYNTITFAVVQRRTIFGTLRALGATRGEVTRLILGEALVIGVVGSLAGLVLGGWLGRALIDQVTRTINDLYFVLTVREVALPVAALWKGAALGIGGSLLAAVAPAVEALSATAKSALDRAELESRIHRLLPAVTLLGVALGLAGWLLLEIRSGLAASFIGLFAVLLGFALLTPAATVGLTALVTPAAGRLFGPLGRMAARGVTASLSRTGVAIAALMMAVSVTVGVDLMIGSFRGTVERWLEYSLPADLYVASTARPGSSFASAGGGIEPREVASIAALPGVTGVNTVRSVEVQSPAGPTRLLAYDLDPRGREAFRLAEGRLGEAWRQLDAGGVWVSEPLALRRGLEVGDEIALASSQGERRFRVAAVYYDYASEQGAVMMARSVYDALWNDPEVTALSVYVAGGTGLDRVAGDIRRELAGRQALRVRSNQELRRESLVVFDRTFVVTGVLRLLAVVVAFVGVLSALTALQLERERELAVLRAYGLGPGQVWRLVTAQTGLMGLVAGVLSIPTGLTMAGIMIYVINRRSFGWTLELTVSPTSLLLALALAVAAALLAGLYPAYKMSRTSPAEALRGE